MEHKIITTFQRVNIGDLPCELSKVGIESYLKGKYANLLPGVILSGLTFVACGMSMLLTNLNFLKGMTEGRTKTYQKKS